MNLIKIWRDSDRITTGLASNQNGTAQPTNGRSGLIQLAIHVLSITPNSAATERLFSQFGIIHSRLRNRLSVEKVRKQALVRADTITRHGFLRGNKRKFIETEDDDSMTTPTPMPTVTPTTARSASMIPPAADHSNPSSTLPASSTTFDSTPNSDAVDTRLFTPIVGELLGDLEDDDNAEPPVGGSILASANCAATTAAATADDTTHLLLKNIFHYPATVSGSSISLSTLREFWSTCEAGFHAEIVVHDTLHAQQTAQDENTTETDSEPEPSL